MELELRFLRRRAVSWALVVLVTLSGCGGDEGTGPDDLTVDDLAGTWAGTEFSMTGVANPALAFDLVSLGGAIQLSLQPSGNFTGFASIPGILLGNPEGGPVNLPLTGLVRILDRTRFRIDFIPEIPPVFTAREATFSLDGDRLTVVDEGADYDFDDDGTREPAVFRAILVRN